MRERLPMQKKLNTEIHYDFHVKFPSSVYIWIKDFLREVIPLKKLCRFLFVSTLIQLQENSQ